VGGRARLRRAVTRHYLQVFIVGGGDGGVLREVVRHVGVERVVMCDIDRRVVEIARAHFPTTNVALGDPRVELVSVRVWL
jgi:spermidine synthase